MALRVTLDLSARASGRVNKNRTRGRTLTITGCVNAATVSCTSLENHEVLKSLLTLQSKINSAYGVDALVSTELNQ